MLTPYALALAITIHPLRRKLTCLGSAFCTKFLFSYEFLCLRSVNYESFKYTCALRLLNETKTTKKKKQWKISHLHTNMCCETSVQIS